MEADCQEQVELIDAIPLVSSPKTWPILSPFAVELTGARDTRFRVVYVAAAALHIAYAIAGVGTAALTPSIAISVASGVAGDARGT